MDVLDDGVFYEIVPKSNTLPAALKVAHFQRFLQSKGIDFLFVMAPTQNQKQAYTNAAPFLRTLDSLGVKNMDLGKINPFGTDAFYKTDHHWTLPTALWAAQQVAFELNKTMRYNLNVNMLDKEKFDSIVYPKMFLGSYGRRMYWDDDRREDFVELWPKYETHFTNQTNGGTFEGEFGEVLSPNRLRTPNGMADDFYVRVFDDFSAHNFDSLAVPKSLFVVGNSYSRPVAGFLSLVFQNTMKIENANLSECVMEQVKPDLVILLETPSALSGKQLLANVILGEF
jgi:hypothetical protein